jgi:putative tricarboxylic transport membrane protein
MKKQDRVTSMVWFCLGLFIAAYSPRFKLGTSSEPGSGLLPFISGVVICICSAITFLLAVKEKSGRAKEIWNHVQFRKLLFVFIVLLFYALMMEKLGFILCTFGMVFLLVKFVDPQSWVTSILAAGASSVASYLLFETWLQTQLPRGILGY